MGGEVTMAERKFRVHKIFEMLIAGKAAATVIKFGVEEFGVTAQTVGRYIESADKLMAETLKGKRKHKINRAVTQREVLIERLIETGNYGAAIQGLADKDKLLGLYEQGAAEVSVNIKVNQK